MDSENAFIKDNQTSNSLNWHLATERRVSRSPKDGSPDIYETVILKRDSGEYAERISIDREMDETFLIIGDSWEFKFVAGRSCWHNDKPSDTYIVYFFSPYINERQRQLASSLSLDVEAILLKIPPHRIHSNVAATSVLFQTEAGRSEETLVRADAICNAGPLHC